MTFDITTLKVGELYLLIQYEEGSYIGCDINLKGRPLYIFKTPDGAYRSFDSWDIIAKKEPPKDIHTGSGPLGSTYGFPGKGWEIKEPGKHSCANGNPTKPESNTEDEVERVAKAICSIRYDKYEKDIAQCKSEYVYYMHFNWLDEAKAAIAVMHKQSDSLLEATTELLNVMKPTKPESEVAEKKYLHLHLYIDKMGYLRTSSIEKDAVHVKLPLVEK